MKYEAYKTSLSRKENRKNRRRVRSKDRQAARKECKS